MNDWLDDLREGAVVVIDGSDTLWIVQDIHKSKLTLRDADMGIIELEGVGQTEVMGILETRSLD
jgi:hypothetical protein